ncbi:MAG: tRNA 4-thiouridine(8) synthase ThiI [Mycoplasmataceae bacterium]|jgi:thiamine biosynthesis protein ThiI|nr:tRNA 4-thiouridine(8) synthase ThiI [Mycoplasmataceae bacterium]
MIVYIKYGELTLKGKNRHLFVDKLHNNVRYSLKQFEDVKINKGYDAIIVDNITEENVDKIIHVLQQVSGIALIIKAYESTTDLKELSQDIVKILPNKETTFKVDAKRTDKSYKLNSMEINKEMGGLILDTLPNYHVNVRNPEIRVNIEIKHNKSIFYFDKIKGMGGFPLGINGKVLVLISGGIDSPVAAKLLLKKGFIVDFLTFITPPHTNPKALEKVKKLVKVIAKDIYEPKLYVCNFTNLQNELAHMSIKAYQITLMRRYFFRIARDLAVQNNYQAIATGESLGQVASQTIESMTTIQNAIEGFLVLRPLLIHDKSEIIELAQKYGTYDISIEPYIDCCALFVPKSPATKPTIRTAEKLEKELDFADEVYKNILSKIETEN